MDVTQFKEFLEVFQKQQQQQFQQLFTYYAKQEKPEGSSVTARRAMATNYTVHTKQGVVRGQKKNTKAFSKKEYYSFFGIPYAKPPCGNLRFKDPHPLEPWQGVLDCVEEPEICPQYHVVLQQYLGVEDCLKLNVFTPKLPNGDSTLKAVMVWLHGGGFTFGSGNTDFYAPDYLIEQDVVLVNVNYRVGALGFLTFENSDVPGNAGLKDQSMALRWIQQNISAFGGDPKNVTLFGESAGAVSCHYQMMSPLSRGLFQRVIMQSGSCLNPWAWTADGKSRSFRLAEVLGCKTEDPVEAVEFLRKVSPEDLVKGQKKVLTLKEKATFQFPFVPGVEVPGTGSNFLTKHPKVALQEGDFAHIPVIMGCNSKEGLVVMNDLPHSQEYFQVLNKDIGRVINPNVGIPTDKLQDSLKKIKSYYFGNEDVSWDSLSPYLDFISDILFVIGIDQALMMHLEKANVPIYYYELTYDGQRAPLKTFLRMKYQDQPDLPGVAHSDELCYLFAQNIPGLEHMEPGTLDEKVTFQFTKMWSEFAKTGNPNAPGLGTKWEACKRNKLCYLQISERLEMKHSRLYEQRVSFWNSILNVPLKQKL